MEDALGPIIVNGGGRINDIVYGADTHGILNAGFGLYHCGARCAEGPCIFAVFSSPGAEFLFCMRQIVWLDYAQTVGWITRKTVGWITHRVNNRWSTGYSLRIVSCVERFIHFAPFLIYLMVFSNVYCGRVQNAIFTFRLHGNGMKFPTTTVKRLGPVLRY